jgi:sortase B
VDFEALQAANPDIRGWIYMADSVINYPVLQGETNDTYLRHLPDGRYNTAGCIFIDSACRADMTDLTTILYGHNMHNGSMFAVLESYKKQTFYDSHPLMWYLTPEGTYRLNILAGFIESADHPLYGLYETKEELDAFLDYAFPKSDFRSRYGEKHPEKIFILSTCDYAYEDARYILIAEPVLQN